MKSIPKLIVCFVTCFGAGAIGGVFTAMSVNTAWYAQLIKPALSPPGWVFAPVWNFLYLHRFGTFYTFRNVIDTGRKILDRKNYP